MEELSVEELEELAKHAAQGVTDKMRQRRILDLDIAYAQDYSKLIHHRLENARAAQRVRRVIDDTLRESRARGSEEGGFCEPDANEKAFYQMP